MQNMRKIWHVNSSSTKKHLSVRTVIRFFVANQNKSVKKCSNFYAIVAEVTPSLQGPGSFRAFTQRKM